MDKWGLSSGLTLGMSESGIHQCYQRESDNRYYVNSLQDGGQTHMNDRLRAALTHARQLNQERRFAKMVKCACCGSVGSQLVKDHNHETDQWRGMICRSCNAHIGYIEWALQNPHKAAKIMAYIKYYDPTHKLISSCQC